MNMPIVKAQLSDTEYRSNDAALFETCVRVLTPHHRQQLAELLQEYPELFAEFMENIKSKTAPNATHEQLIATEKKALLALLNAYEN